MRPDWSVGGVGGYTNTRLHFLTCSVVGSKTHTRVIMESVVCACFPEGSTMHGLVVIVSTTPLRLFILNITF